MESDKRWIARNARTSGRIDIYDGARRELWRAYQTGMLSDDEFASLMDRLDWVSVDERRQNDRCEHCHLLGIHAIKAEQIVANLPSARIWRHTKCQHVLMWRASAADVLRSDVCEPSTASRLAGTGGAAHH